MRIHFYANMRTLVGQEVFEVTDSKNIQTLGDLLDLLVQQFPVLRAYLFDSRDQLRSDIPIFIDGRNPRLSTTGLKSTIKPDAIISLFSPISSGRMNVEVIRDSD